MCSIMIFSVSMVVKGLSREEAGLKAEKEVTGKDIFKVEIDLVSLNLIIDHLVLTHIRQWYHMSGLKMIQVLRKELSLLWLFLFLLK